MLHLFNFLNVCLGVGWLTRRKEHTQASVGRVPRMQFFSLGVVPHAVFS